MRRRSFVAGMAAVVAAAPAITAGARKAWRIGVLWTGSTTGGVPIRDAVFRQALRELQYVEGETVAIENRYGDNRPERLHEHATALVSAGVSIIVTHGTPAALAAKKATRTIPIVLTAVGDPIGSGLVDSLARPGRNITGLAYAAAHLSAKRLEILTELVQGLSRVMAIMHADDGSVPGDPYGRMPTEQAARALKVSMLIRTVDGPADVSRAFTGAREYRAQAVVVLPSPVLASYGKSLIALAAEHRLPAMYQASGFVEAGGLISYGPNNAEEVRRAATYVDRIFKGARPGDLPIEQPSTVELVINGKTAKALGLTIPPALLLRADQVIE